MTLLYGFSALIFVVLWAPLLVVVERGFQSSAMLALWTRDDLLWSTLQSVGLATLVGLVSSSVGTITALGFRGSRPQLRSGIEPFLTLPLVLPEIALGLSYMIGFVQIHWPLGWTTLFMAHFAFTYVYAALIMRARVESLDVSLFDAARDLGSGSWGLFRHALWPQILPAFLAAFLSCFALSFDDFLISFFNKGVDQSTLPIQIYSMMKIRLREEIYALSSVLFCLSFFVVLGTQAWLRSKQKSQAQSSQPQPSWR